MMGKADLIAEKLDKWLNKAERKAASFLWRKGIRLSRSSRIFGEKVGGRAVNLGAKISERLQVIALAFRGHAKSCDDLEKSRGEMESTLRAWEERRNHPGTPGARVQGKGVAGVDPTRVVTPPPVVTLPEEEKPGYLGSD